MEVAREQEKAGPQSRGRGRKLWGKKVGIKLFMRVNYTEMSLEKTLEEGEGMGTRKSS